MFSCFYYVKYTGDKMSIQNMHSLSAGHKAKLRKQLIVGARNYNKYLANKIFKIICDDGLLDKLYDIIMAKFLEIITRP